jgi:hypothetical protein
MRARIPSAALKRLADLERPRANPRLAGGVMLVPPRMPLDDWEALAVASQSALAEATRDGIDARRSADPSKETVEERNHWLPGA